MTGYYLILDSGKMIWATDSRSRALTRLRNWNEARAMFDREKAMAIPRRVIGLARVTMKKPGTPRARGRGIRRIRKA